MLSFKNVICMHILFLTLETYADYKMTVQSLVEL